MSHLRIMKPPVLLKEEGIFLEINAFVVLEKDLLQFVAWHAQ